MLRSLFAMDDVPEEQKWQIKGDFNRTFESDRTLNRMLEITPLFNNNYIRNIFVLGHCDRDNTIEIKIFVSKLSDDIFEEIKDFATKEEGASCFRSTNKLFLDKYLSAFYVRNLIPDFLIDRIIKDICIDEFRIDIGPIISRINDEMGDNATEEEFERIGRREIMNIKNPIRRHKIIWHIVQLLVDEPSKFSKKTIINWCELINDPTLSFYVDVQILMADLLMSDYSDKHARYQKAITVLLQVCDHPEAQKHLNILIRAFISNDRLTSDVPAELQNLTLSPEAIFGLLDIIRKQNLELLKSAK
jgi:hypothetical protein